MWPGEGSGVIEPPQRPRHRRGSAPHPIRLARWTRAKSAPTRCQPVVHRLHRHTESRRRTAIRAWSSAITSATIYDIQRAVADKATVAIYYASRVAKLGLNQNDLPNIDQEFEPIIEGKKLKEERAGHANSSRSRILKALRKSSSHQATSPVWRGGLRSWSFLRAFVASAWTTRKW